MKKLLLTLGTVATIVAPVASVVACGSTTSVKPKEVVNPFKDIKEDGLYLWDKTYDGVLLDNKTIADGIEKEGIQEIGVTGGFALDNSVQLGKRDPSDKTQQEDSIYMVYDDDDTDGISMDNFTDTFYFEDTSVSWDKDIAALNKDVLGNVVKPGMFGSSIYTKFVEGDTKYSGKMNQYFGSQNNHVSSGAGYAKGEDFQKRMKAFANNFKDSHPDGVNSLLKYYGLKTTPEADGTYAADPSILNHANLGFAPVYFTEPIFTYEKVFDNVLKITYHDSDTYQCTAAHFRLKEGDKYVELGSLSLGKDDWSSYFGHKDAKYVATKSDQVGPKPVVGDKQGDGSTVYQDINPTDGINKVLKQVAAFPMQDSSYAGMIEGVPGVGRGTVVVVKTSPNGAFAVGDMVKFDFNGKPTKAIFNGTDFDFKQ